MKPFRFVLAGLGAALVLGACHAPGQAQATRTQGAQMQGTQRTQTAQTLPARVPASTDPVSGLPWTTVPALPPQGQQTYRLILSGGPFPYARDGVVFQNREGALPARSRGSYHEYTVRTPGSSDRGARRIVCAPVPATAGPECYYTGDHYASFQRIRP